MNSIHSDRQEAILLLGPTASGKTPLGEVLQRRGLWNRRCLHFDFGAALRQSAPGRHEVRRPPGPLSDEEIGAVRRSLESGALLTDEQFPIARKLLRLFLAARARPGDLVVLNGLPRHLGQADGIDSFMRIVAVVNLRCTDEVISERIRADAGGDRADRTDDAAAAVARRLATFTARTAGLLDHYRRTGATIIDVDVGTATTGQDLWDAVDRHGPP